MIPHEALDVSSSGVAELCHIKTLLIWDHFVLLHAYGILSFCASTCIWDLILCYFMYMGSYYFLADPADHHDHYLQAREGRVMLPLNRCPWLNEDGDDIGVSFSRPKEGH